MKTNGANVNTVKGELSLLAFTYMINTIMAVDIDTVIKMAEDGYLNKNSARLLRDIKRCKDEEEKSRIISGEMEREDFDEINDAYNQAEVQVGLSLAASILPGLTKLLTASDKLSDDDVAIINVFTEAIYYWFNTTSEERFLWEIKESPIFDKSIQDIPTKSLFPHNTVVVALLSLTNEISRMISAIERERGK